MKNFVSTIVVSCLTFAAVVNQNAFAQNTNKTEAEAKMFAVSAGYERFMGRWSRLLAPAYVAFAGVKNGDRVLRCGHRDRLACGHLGSEHARERGRRH